mgnify:CR=1 FL=1
MNSDFWVSFPINHVIIYNMVKEHTHKLSEPKIIDTFNKQQGYWYVHRDQSYWDKEKKQTRHVRTTIGKRLSKDGPIIYNDRFKAEQLQSIPPDVAISRTQQLGETLILDSMVAELKIMKQLTKAFGRDSAEKIIGLAEYVICTKRALSWAGDWAEGRNEHIEGMTSQSVSKFLSALKPDARNTFFKNWMAVNSCDSGYYCFDSTNIGGYNTETNPLVEYGYTHGHISLPQVNLAILSRQDSYLPVHSVLFNGSRHDSTTLKDLIRQLQKMDLQKICVTLDKGYYSEENMEFVRKAGYDFIIPVPKRVAWQYAIIDQVRDELYTLSARTEIADADGNSGIIQCLTRPVIRNHHRYYLHIVYNPAIRADAEKDFIELLESCRVELQENKLKASHKDLYEQFFIVKDTPKRGRRVMQNTAYMAEFQKKYAGYWCLFTNRKTPKEEVYSAYQQRNTAEIFYDSFKNDLQGDRVTDHTLATYEGKMFILFIALVILTRLKRQLEMKRKNNKVLSRIKTYSQLLFRMSTLAKVSYEGTYNPIYSTPSKLQREIITNFHLLWPGSS